MVDVLTWGLRAKLSTIGLSIRVLLNAWTHVMLESGMVTVSYHNAVY